MPHPFCNGRILTTALYIAFIYIHIHNKLYSVWPFDYGFSSSFLYVLYTKKQYGINLRILFCDFIVDENFQMFFEIESNAIVDLNE